MKRYAAFLRGVGPTTAKMPELKRAFEAAGFTDVKTVLSSGNLVFAARASSASALERRAEAAMQGELGKTFYTIVRSIEELEGLLATDPYAAFRVARGAKRVVSFFRQAPKPKLELPAALDNARVLSTDGREAFTAYTPEPGNPTFMVLIERTFGKDVTTRTWETVEKVARAGAPGKKAPARAAKTG